MERLASVRWQSPFPTSIDEELAVYDDGSVWLVVCASREGTPAIGSWSMTPGAADHAALAAAGDVSVDLLHAQTGLGLAEHVRAAALDAPVAVARFMAGRGAGETVTLAAVGEGARPVQLELDPASLAVHVQRDGATLAWFEATAPITGFITPDAVGLGGLGRRAEIAPGVFGAITFDVPGLGAVDGDVAVQASGWLAEGLPDEDSPRAFRVRSAVAERG